MIHFCSLWFAVAMLSRKKDAYNEAIAVLRKEAPARFVDYVEQTWLPYALKFAAFHTNQHFHLGQRTSSRVEGAHAKLNRALESSRCDVRRLVVTCISVVYNWLEISMVFMLVGRRVAVVRGFGSGVVIWERS